MFWLIYKIFMGGFFIIIPIIMGKMMLIEDRDIFSVIVFICLLFCNIGGIVLVLAMPM